MISVENIGGPYIWGPMFLGPWGSDDSRRKVIVVVWAHFYISFFYTQWRYSMVTNLRMYWHLGVWKFWYWLIEQRWAPEWLICLFDQSTETLNELDRWEYGENDGMD